MGYKWFKASAPGSFFWMGEHAVLYGKEAVVSGIDQRIEVFLVPHREKKRDPLLSIYSALCQGGREDFLLASLSSSLSHRLRFILEIFSQYRQWLPGGCSLYIRSQFSEKVGLGSSAAVTVATCAVLQLWLGRSLHTFSACEKENIFFHSLQVIQKVQGRGSGGDVAASVWGGFLLYKTPVSHSQLLVEKISSPDFSPPFHLVYTGEKTETAVVIKRVKGLYEEFPSLLHHCFNLIEQSTIEGKSAIEEGNWKRLGRLFNIHQGALESLGVSNGKIASLIHFLHSFSSLYGCKISGSGLGDCILVLGSLPSLKGWEREKVRKIAVQLSQRGVCYQPMTTPFEEYDEK